MGQAILMHFHIDLYNFLRLVGLKSSVVSGAYKQMKIENPPVVKNVEEYVDKAIEVANLNEETMHNNKNYYSESANAHLYENKKFILELEILLTDIYLQHQ